jgi:hypothetical protein
VSDINMANEFYVALDGDSSIGRMYMQGNADGTINVAGAPTHPVLICQSLEPNKYLYVERRLAEAHIQRIHIPHAAVVSIYVIGPDEPRPIGFTPNR